MKRTSPTKVPQSTKRQIIGTCEYIITNPSTKEKRVCNANATHSHESKMFCTRHKPKTEIQQQQPAVTTTLPTTTTDDTVLFPKVIKQYLRASKIDIIETPEGSGRYVYTPLNIIFDKTRCVATGTYYPDTMTDSRDLSIEQLTFLESHNLDWDLSPYIDVNEVDAIKQEENDDIDAEDDAEDDPENPDNPDDAEDGDDGDVEDEDAEDNADDAEDDGDGDADDGDEY